MRSRKAEATPAWRSLLGGCLGGAGSGDKQRKVRPGGGGRLSFTDLSGAADQDLSVSLVGSNLHVFSVPVLRAATRGFESGNFLGEGGFGPVYKGFVDEGVKKGLNPQAIAVKLWDPEGAQGHKEWLVRLFFYSPVLPSLIATRVLNCSSFVVRVLIKPYGFLLADSCAVPSTI
jgi:hypothetical protein